MSVASSLRDRTHALLERPPDGDRAAAWVQNTIIVLIVVSVAALIVETVQPWGTDHRSVFRAIEWLAVSVFTIEYALRVWAAAEDPRYRGVGGRLRYMVSPLALLDLLAILPYYVTLASFDMRFLRLFRILRLFRLAKLARYSSALRALGRVVIAKRFELAVTLALGGLLLLIAASMMYYVETDAQPDAFTSIPATMWWAIATLTTVGYGDLAPITPLGRMLGGFIAILGIGMFALPTGILGAAFVGELERMSQESEDAGVCPTCGQRFPD